MATTALKTTHAGWRDYLQLCKPNVVALIVFTAVVGMLLAAPGMVPLDALVWEPEAERQTIVYEDEKAAQITAVAASGQASFI